jgi:hypothetical protein
MSYVDTFNCTDAILALPALQALIKERDEYKAKLLDSTEKAVLLLGPMVKIKEELADLWELIDRIAACKQAAVWLGCLVDHQDLRVKYKGDAIDASNIGH